MKKIRHSHEDFLSEIVFGSEDPNISQAIRRAVKSKKLRKIASKIYTSNWDDAPETILHRHRYAVLGKFFPGAVISHRSALEGGFSSDHSIILTYKYTKNVGLPGMSIRLVKGATSQSEDMPFNTLFLSSRARAFLENLQLSRERKALTSKTVPAAILEKRLVQMIHVYGPEELNNLREQARILAPILHMENEFIKLNNLISALLGTYSANILQTDIAKARAGNTAYDAYRQELFSTLTIRLQSYFFEKRLSLSTTAKAKQNFAFFEAYFSNFIEGTEFEIEEAKNIIFHEQIIPSRNADSHDILGTYKIVSNTAEMKKVPHDLDSLITLLNRRHALLMEARPDKTPGKFKTIANRFGQTIFVKPDEIIGTLQKGLEYYRTLEPGMARAIFMMFLVAEVHPFLDGNGRIARIMMNSELEASGLCKIIIPTVYREDYLSTLQRLSRQNDPDSFIRMLDRAQAYSAAFNFEDYEKTLKSLQESHAFFRPSEGKLVLPIR